MILSGQPFELVDVLVPIGLGVAPAVALQEELAYLLASAHLVEHAGALSRFGQDVVVGVELVEFLQEMALR